jgi:predicted dehydrogenase
VKLRVALVGCGKVADQHVGEIHKLDNASVVAVCDRELLMAEQLAVRCGIANYYSDFDRMLEETKPDVVHVTTPPQSHVALATRALDFGCHVLVEKPLALDGASAQRFIDHVIRSGRKMTVGYTYYFDPVCRRMREMLREGFVGEVVHVESVLGYDLSGPFGEPILADGDHWVRQLPGQLFHNVIDHLVNKITEFVIDDRPTILAHALPRISAGDFPDELRIMILGENVSGYATFSSHARPLAHFLTVFGTRNTLHMDLVSGCMTSSSKPALPGAVGRLSCAFGQARQYFFQGARNVARFARSEYQYFAGLNFLFSAFYNSIIHDAPVPIPYSEILRVSACMDEIFDQLRRSPVPAL